MEWNPLQHPFIIDGYDISPYGDIRFNNSSLTYKASYHSTNGYDYAMFTNTDGKQQLFPIDEIVAMVYLPVPDELCGKRLTINHINGDTRDISLDNLEWIEDIEIWKDITYPGVKTGLYEVSNHGRVRNKRRQTILSQRVMLGYLYVNLISTSVISRNYRTHRLVAHEFISKETGKNEVNHINLNKQNPTWKNLEWVDRRQNEEHYYAHQYPKNSRQREHKEPKKESSMLTCKT